MKVRNVFTILFSSIIFINLVILILLGFLLANKNTQTESEKNRFHSLWYSTQMRRSSYNLTAFSRTYVVTGNPEWEEKFHLVLDTRSGDFFRKALRDSITDAGFVQEEFDLFGRALENSDALALIEEEAMNMVKGRYRDKNGAYTVEGPPNREKAIDLLYNHAYMTAIAGVHIPMTEFEEMVNNRTRKEAAAYTQTGDNLLTSIFLLTGFVVLFSGSGFIMIRRRIKREEEISEELARSQQQFESLVNSIPGIIYNCDLDDPWEMHYITDEIEEITGYPKEDFLGKNPKRQFGDIMHPDDRTQASEQVQKAITANESYALDYRIFHKDGRLINVNGYGKAIRGSDRIPEYLVGGIFDDTERQTAVEKVKESEERFQLAAKGSNAGIWDLDVESGSAYWSDIHYHLLGYEVNEIEPTLSFVHDSVYENDLDLFGRSVENHIEKGDLLDFEARFHTKNGDLRWFRSRGAAARDEKGKAVRIVGTFTDITEKKEAENALAAKEQQLQYALDVANEGIWEWNEETDAFSYSVRCFSMIGYLPVKGEQELMDFWNKVIHKDDVEKALINNIENVKKRGLYDNIYRAVSNSEEIKWIHVKGKAVEFSASGKPSRIIGTMSDITDRMRQEEKIVSAILETEDSERSRIARDIHDGLQQTMSTSLMSFEKVRSSIDFEDPKIYDKFHMGYKFLKKAIEESRTLAHNLMPKVVDQAGIVAAIESLISAIKDSSETKFVFEQNLNDERLKLSEK